MWEEGCSAGSKRGVHRGGGQLLWRVCGHERASCCGEKQSPKHVVTILGHVVSTDSLYRCSTAVRLFEMYVVIGGGQGVRQSGYVIRARHAVHLNVKSCDFWAASSEACHHH